MNMVVQVEGRRKVYGTHTAIDQLSFEMYEGEIFGLLGPNGAGKSKTMECVASLRTPGQGKISVLGINQLVAKTLFNEPGSPWENSHIESFNDKSRDELLNREIFYPSWHLRNQWGRTLLPTHYSTSVP